MSLLIDVKIIPSSGQQKCIIDKTGIIKCYLKSVPEKGKANAEIVKLFGKLLSIPQKNVSIISGTKSRRKKIKIDDEISYEEVCNIIAGAE